MVKWPLMPDYPPDLGQDEIQSVLGRQEDMSDYAWWNDKMKYVPTRWVCPTCEPEVDPDVAERGIKEMIGHRVSS